MGERGSHKFCRFQPVARHCSDMLRLIPLATMKFHLGFRRIRLLTIVSKYSSTVQRVIITSSMSAIVQHADQQQTLTEKDWNHFSLQEVNAKGREAAPLHKYRASKTLAERSKPRVPHRDP